MNKARVILAVVLAAAAGRPTAAATFVEVGDAGQTIDFAQDVAAVGPVTTIYGRIENAFDADVFRLVIEAPISFSAQAYWPGTDVPDLQLFLFDAAGRGVVADDDWLASPLPQLPAASLVGREAGEYLLAVSAFDNDPQGAIDSIFPNGPNVKSLVVTPTGLAAFDVLFDWQRDVTANAGDYAVVLSGARGLLEPAAADFDEDGDVDGADLVRWRTSFGLGAGALHTQGDADGDSDVDGGDFLVWQRQLGSHAYSAATTGAVPEPETLWLLFTGGAPLVRRRLGRRRFRVSSAILGLSAVSCREVCDATKRGSQLVDVCAGRAVEPGDAHG